MKFTEEGDVRLAIHDVTGRLVIDLARGKRDAGTHTVKWDGRDRTGTHVGMGLYFVRLETAGRVVSRSLVVLE